MTLNVQDPAPVKIEDDHLPYTEQFKHLGSTVRHNGGVGSDISNRIGKATNAIRMLNPLWKSQQYKTHTKSFRLYYTGLSSFHTKALRKIVRIFWPQQISNQDLLDQCQQESIEITITCRLWRWIGHILRKDQVRNHYRKTTKWKKMISLCVETRMLHVMLTTFNNLFNRRGSASNGKVTVDKHILICGRE